MKIQLSLTAAAVLALSAAGAMAQSKQSVYVGGSYIDVHSSSTPLVGGAALPEPAYLEVQDSSTIGFGYAYHFTPEWGVELALGVPPKHKTDGDGFIAPFGQISSTRVITPTLFLNYHFNVAALGPVQPFVGVGLNYTHFTDNHSTEAGNAAGGGPTRFKLSDSWGGALHVGMNYTFYDKWMLVATVTYADVKSDLTSTTSTNAGDIVRTSTIKFNPMVYTVGLGYSF